LIRHPETAEDRAARTGRGRISLGSPLSGRALVVALVLMAVNITLVFYAEPVRGTQFSNSGLFAPVLFLLFLLTAINALIARAVPRAALSAAELLTVYVMLSVQTGLSSGRFIFWLLCSITYGFRYASPSNQWLTLYGPYLPTWLTVRDAEALRGFYLGNATLFTPHLLGVWLAPVLAWTLFLAVMGLVLTAIAARFAPSWIHRERLTFPVVELPFQLVAEGSSFWRQRGMWLGFGLAAGMELLNGLQTWFPTVPMIPLRRTNVALSFTDKPWNAIRELNLSFYPFIAGLSYLMPLDLSFSALVFYFFSLGQHVLGSIEGLDQNPYFPYSRQQQFGAVLVILWTVLLSAWRDGSRRRGGSDGTSTRFAGTRTQRRQRGHRAKEANTSISALPSRAHWSTWVIVLGSLFLVGFLVAAGMSAWVAAVVVLAYLGLGLVVARIRAQLGFPNHVLARLNGATMLTETVGGQALGLHNLPMLAMVDGITYYNSNHILPHQVEGLKLADRQRMDAGSMTRAILLAILVSIPATFLINLALIYHLGVATAKVRWGVHLAHYTWEQSLPQWLGGLRQPNLLSVGVIAGSAAVASALMALRYRWLGFPLHPVGMALVEPMGDVWGAVAVGALMKGVILRYAGLRGYRAALPFFLGLILGDIVMGMTWVVIGVLFDVPTYVFFL
jgi:hypothetical protein